jgi:hypothetical protein
MIDDRVAVNALAPAGVVPTPGAVLHGLVPDDPGGVEDASTFAEAALALCGGTPSFLTGHVTTSAALLRYLDQEQ